MSDEELFRRRVELVLDTRVRPALRAHNGDVSLRDASDGVVRVAFTGACRACPSARITLEETVGQALRDELGDAIKSVTLVNEIDDELLNMARQLLGRHGLS